MVTRWLPFREAPGVLDDGPVWVWGDAEYLYLAPSLCGLLWQMATEWRNDRHLAG